MNGQVYDQSVFWIIVSSLCATTLVVHIALNRRETRVVILDVILVIWSVSIIWTRAHSLPHDAEYQRNFNKRHSDLSGNPEKNPNKPAPSTAGIISLNQESPSEAALTRNDVADWTPSYVRQRLGDPVTRKGPFKNAYYLQYDGIGFFFDAPANVESDKFQAIVIEKQNLPTGAGEFMHVVPSGINIGCTPSAMLSILGEPEVVKQDGEFTWYTYNDRKGDWRRYWLRFRNGKLEMINISVEKHGQS